MADDYYMQVFKQNLLKEEEQLKSLKEEAKKLKKQYGEKDFRYIKALERISISSEYISGKKYFLEHGVPRSPIQSVALPPDILEKL